MKKLIALLLSLALCLALVACGGAKKEETKTEEPAPADEAAPAEDYYNNSYATPAADTAVVAVPDSAVAYDYNYGY